ncbi:undecaprenyl-phosphate galactose phosphotransferase WbaP [Megamonas hypermegale]|uniref:undecaprenyl-phosphate galactose phosphotransferase WbaP n=1 Tax=Megamonas hypermegale TaxID=158847 RepID=UPI0026EDA4F1|nr:undecaprenyl-phosphate galactose phosphotransferase WbaP [Megamonas hypermegale]
MKNEFLQEKAVKSDYIAHYITPLIAAVGDYIAIILAEKAVYELTKFVLGESFKLIIPNAYFYFWIPAVFIFFLFNAGAHKRMVPFFEIVKNTLCGTFYATVSAIFILYLAHSINDLSRFFVIMFFVMSFIFICVIHQILVIVFNKLDILKEPVLFIGANNTTKTIIHYLKNNNCFGVRVLGVIGGNFADDYAKDIDKIIKFIEKTKVKTVIISSVDINKMAKVVTDIQPLVKNIVFTPNLINIPIANLEINKLPIENVVLLNVKNNLALKRNKIIKYVFDMVLTIIGTICISPVLICIAIWIYKDSPGPIIFKHMRVGKNGKEFPCYKFRSMCVDAKEKLEELLKNDPQARVEWEKDFKLKNDPRITKSGAFLRRTSLDELPQIFNVLKGEMSLVGPRPIIKEEMKRYGKHIDDYLMVKPGIAGIWQCSGRSDVSYEERVQMDSWYVRNWSVWLDIMILWRTLKAVFAEKGAY